MRFLAPRRGLRRYLTVKQLEYPLPREARSTFWCSGSFFLEGCHRGTRSAGFHSSLCKERSRDRCGGGWRPQQSEVVVQVFGIAHADHGRCDPGAPARELQSALGIASRFRKRFAYEIRELPQNASPEKGSAGEDRRSVPVERFEPRQRELL